MPAPFQILASCMAHWDDRRKSRLPAQKPNPAPGIPLDTRKAAAKETEATSSRAHSRHGQSPTPAKLTAISGTLGGAGRTQS